MKEPFNRQKNVFSFFLRFFFKLHEIYIVRIPVLGINIIYTQLDMC